MLRLLDVRTGSYAEIRPTRPGLLRVCAHVPDAAGGAGLAGLRVLLVTDLLARVAELGNLQALTVLSTDGELPGYVPAAESAADALGIHPPAARTNSGDDQAADVHVISYGTSVSDRQSGVVACVGDAHMLGTAVPANAEGGLLAGNEQDPLAFRLALMSFPFHQTADLTDSMLAGTREMTGDWRRRVARWAEWPSRPIPPHLAEAARGAFAELDTPLAIALLQGLADDDSVPAGAKFETFLYADRVLGLDLPRDIGKLA